MITIRVIYVGDFIRLASSSQPKDNPLQFEQTFQVDNPSSTTIHEFLDIIAQSGVPSVRSGGGICTPRPYFQRGEQQQPHVVLLRLFLVQVLHTSILCLDDCEQKNHFFALPTHIRHPYFFLTSKTENNQCRKKIKWFHQTTI